MPRLRLNYLPAGSANYSRIRLWGSVGFVVASAVIGLLLEYHGPALLPWLILILIARQPILPTVPTVPITL